jgi:two-component system chemotaxis response regulator CheV
MNTQQSSTVGKTNEMGLLTIFVDDQPFGINIDKVQSIQQYDPKLVTGLPEKQDGVAGMFLYRGKTIPLLDLAQLLDIELRNEYENEIIVVTEFNKTVNSFKAQGVKRIYRLSWKEFVPLNRLFEDNAYFTGSVNVDDTEILVLDLEHITADIFPDILVENLSQEILDLQSTISRDDLKILLAEDSPTMRKAAIEKLNQAGFNNIKGFANGGDAMKHIAQTYKGKTEAEMKALVLIADIDMPVMDGLTLCQQIKNDPELKEIYVVMFSSLINDQMVIKCKKVKADAYVTKPEINQLIQILDKRC